MRWLFPILLVFVPLSSFAAVGFAQESVWLSHTPVIAGETVSIYAALTNGGAETLTTTAYFRDNGIRIGSLPVSLQPGEARIVSLSWTPSVGKHSLAVELASSSVQLAKGTQTTTVTVEKPSVFSALSIPKDSAVAATAFTDSSGIQAQIAKLSPLLDTYTKPVFSTIDSWRLRGSTLLQAQASSSKEKAQAARDEKVNIADGKTDTSYASQKLTFSQILHTLLMYIFSALQFLLAKAAFFFPLLAFVFFLLLWKLYRRYIRPKYK